MICQQKQQTEIWILQRRNTTKIPLTTPSVQKFQIAQKKHPNNQHVTEYCIPTTPPTIFDETHTILLDMDSREQLKCLHITCPYSTNKMEDTSMLDIPVTLSLSGRRAIATVQ
jgi:hypothetical protein